MLSTIEHLLPTDFPVVTRLATDTVQANLGYLCNQQCLHCHVNAGPKRTELMSRETMARIFKFIEQHPVTTLDLTGGAPEMNPDFRWMVEKAVSKGLRVIDRCNLTILSEPGYEWLGDFLAEHSVEVVASLPCYLEDNVDRQRGKGVFDQSLLGLKQLNELGYGRGKHALNLVFNPQGTELVPDQAKLESDYRQFLKQQFDIDFDHLLTITNMPIQRFGSTLLSKGHFHSYLETLKGAYSPANLPKVMCRSLVSVDWEGYVYDCDFNQMLKLPVDGKKGIRIDQLNVDSLLAADIVTGKHCWACVAGAGSSCGGALSD
ncbi:MAG: radical SAM/Cys-rich domain protein [Methylococcales bacterium]|jgi:radical SAM/Cys-rich protein|nr:radical SAM/Cys-rich domain protein [Methylococcales bacterium]MBT7442957.1 radical SAM/Cys-rich domain protein [Methylococcales bacterium]